MFEYVFGINVDVEGFKEKFKEHQEKSRTASAGKFKGGLAGDGEIETKYHTCTHLLNAALKVVVDENVHQKGSNITAERMRFDFSCDHKLTDEEKARTEEIVNNWIKEDLKVVNRYDVQGVSVEALNEGINIILKRANRGIQKDKFSAFEYGLYYIKHEEENKKKRKKFKASDWTFMN